jgi:probable HAF family extracellular repeat protein
MKVTDAAHRGAEERQLLNPFSDVSGWGSSDTFPLQREVKKLIEEETMMKLNISRAKSFRIARIGLALAVFAGPVWAQEQQQQKADRHPHYTLTDLGTLPGGTFSQATFVNNNGVVSGLATAPDGTQHAVLWDKERIMDIAKPRLAGPNSGAFGVNERGQAEVQAEAFTNDPNSENFCGYGTGLKCLPFLWQDGVMTPLPTLGGFNGTVGQINNRGEVAGIAENSTRDPECVSGVAVNGTGPQILDFEAVIWGPRQGEIRELHPLRGDTVGEALWINDNGQAVGSSGSCANTIPPPFAAGPHAVLWEKDGSVRDLGNLGGRANPSVLGSGNIAFSINNRGQVVGASALPGDATFHAFLWTKDTGIRDLGTLSGDVYSTGLAINDQGDVVGASVGAGGPLSDARAYLWQNGVMIDLNSLIPTDSPLYLLTAFGINNGGEIVGFGLTSTFEVHAFLATPKSRCDTEWCRDNTDATGAEVDETTERPRVVLPENALKVFQQELSRRYHTGRSQ